MKKKQPTVVNNLVAKHMREYCVGAGSHNTSKKCVKRTTIKQQLRSKSYE